MNPLDNFRTHSGFGTHFCLNFFSKPKWQLAVTFIPNRNKDNNVMYNIECFIATYNVQILVISPLMKVYGNKEFTRSMYIIKSMKDSYNVHIFVQYEDIVTYFKVYLLST